MFGREVGNMLVQVVVLLEIVAQGPPGDIFNLYGCIQDSAMFFDQLPYRAFQRELLAEDVEAFFCLSAESLLLCSGHAPADGAAAMLPLAPPRRSTGEVSLQRHHKRGPFQGVFLLHEATTTSNMFASMSSQSSRRRPVYLFLIILICMVFSPYCEVGVNEGCLCKCLTTSDCSWNNAHSSPWIGILGSY